VFRNDLGRTCPRLDPSPADGRGAETWMVRYLGLFVFMQIGSAP
jgi:hypothetical protein